MTRCSRKWEEARCQWPTSICKSYIDGEFKTTECILKLIAYIQLLEILQWQWIQSHDSSMLSWWFPSLSVEDRLTSEIEICRPSVVVGMAPCSQKASELLEANWKSSSRKLCASHDEIEKSSQSWIICSGSNGIRWTFAVWSNEVSVFIGWVCMLSLLDVCSGDGDILVGDANTLKGLYVSSSSCWGIMAWFCQCLGCSKFLCVLWASAIVVWWILCALGRCLKCDADFRRCRLRWKRGIFFIRLVYFYKN